MASPPIDLSKLSWKDSDVEASLATLNQYVEDLATEQIRWYWDKKQRQAKTSMRLRRAAILLTALGGFVPILKGTLRDTLTGALPFDFGQSGYLLIAAAAGCMALDRYFGYSTAWIRYVTTAMAIEKSLEEYRLEWTRKMAALRGAAPTTAQVLDLVQTAAGFDLAVRSQVEQETKAWVTEFQNNLSQLEKDLQTKADEAKAKAKPAAAGGSQ